MNEWVDESLDTLVNVQLNDWVNAWIVKWTSVLVKRQMEHRLVSESTGRWLEEYMDGQVDE